ncbi:MAG: transcription termination/antitermination protein NusG [Candidatus Latescibacterota bacterium]
MSTDHNKETNSTEEMDAKASKMENEGAEEQAAEVSRENHAVIEPAVAGEAAASGGKKARSGAKAKETKKAKPGTPAAEATGADNGSEDKPGLPLKWYVVHTYSGHENKVKENILKMVNTSAIKDQFGRLIVPTEEVAEMKKGKKTITTHKFFPSYILIEMFMTNDSWHLVNSIPGVTSFVGSGKKPQPLSQPEVDRILGRMDKEKQSIAPEIPFTVGEHIRIKDGPFSDFTGVIDEINVEKGKLKVLVSIFGRETPVELDFLQVEPI